MKYWRVLLLGLACSLPQVLRASDPPDSRYNPFTGKTEIVDTVSVQGQYDIRYTVSDGDTKPVSSWLSTGGGPDRRPRIDISPLGDTWVCWYREAGATARVICRGRKLGAPQWSPELLMSELGVNSRMPVVKHDGLRAWVAFEIADGTGRDIAVNSIDEPDPVVPCPYSIAQTNFTGDVDIRLHHTAGRLWLTWVDSSFHVAWSEYDYVTDEWSQPLYFPYFFGLVDQALELIQTVVLAP